MAPPVADLSVQEFADLVGVTSQRVYQLVQAGMPHRKQKNATRIVAREAIRWMRERDRTEALVERDVDEAKARARKLTAEADLKELELAALRRSLVPASEVTTFLEAFVGGFASIAAGQLGRFEREMVKATTAAEARVLRKKIHIALIEGARRYADSLDKDAADLDEGEKAA